MNRERRFQGGQLGLRNSEGLLEALRAEGQTLVKAAARALAAEIKAETDALLESGVHGLGPSFLGSVAEEEIRASSVPTVRHV